MSRTGCTVIIVRMGSFLKLCNWCKCSGGAHKARLFRNLKSCVSSDRSVSICGAESCEAGRWAAASSVSAIVLFSFYCFFLG